jgi:hypothetical protein
LIDSILPLPRVEVEEVDHTESIPILICVENETEFVEQEFGVEFCDLRIRSFVDDESTSSGNGFEDELMFRRVVLARDEFGELLDRFVDRVTGQRGRIRVEVDGEGIEGSELVNSTSRVGDEGRLPFRVGRDHREVGKGDSDGEGMTGNRDFVFVSNVEVFDLRNMEPG